MIVSFDGDVRRAGQMSCGVCAIIPRGPTLSLRISRSQSIRCASFSLVVVEVLTSTRPLVPKSVVKLRRATTDLGWRGAGERTCDTYHGEEEDVPIGLSLGSASRRVRPRRL